MQTIKIAGMMFLASGLVACGGAGGSSSGGNTPAVGAQLSIDAMTTVPVINGSATKGTLYIHNYGTTTASGLNFDLNNATTSSKLKSTLASMGLHLNNSMVNSDGFTLINPELCSSIRAGGSCAINFSTPGLAAGDRGNSLVTLSYKSNGTSLITNQVVNYQYVSLSALDGVNFSGSLNVGGTQGSTQHVVGYLYGGGASGSKYQNVTLAATSAATSISNGFINGQEVAAGQVVAVELAVNLQDNQSSAVNVVPYWGASKTTSTAKKSTQATTSGNSGGMLSLTLTPSQNLVNYIFGAIPILTAPTTTAAVISVTNNGNAASSGGLTATSSDAELTITDINCATTALLANAANYCEISFSVAGYTPGSATVTFKDNAGTTVGTQTVIWTNDMPVPAVYILPNTSPISFGKGQSTTKSSTIFTLTNIGHAPLNSATYTPTNTGPATWTQDSTNCTASIAPRGSCTIRGHFTGTDDGTGQFYIRAQGGYGSSNYSFVSLPLNYTVSSAPALEITPPSGDQNMTVLANGTSTKTVVYTIKNDGNDPALITNIGLSESNTSYKPSIDTSVAGACPSSGTLASGDQCTVTVVYGPIPASLTTNESGIAQLNINYHGGTPDLSHNAQFSFNYNAVGNDSSVTVGTATSNIPGSGTQADPFSGNASLDPMKISINYTNNSSNYAMTGFSLDTSNLPYGVVVDPSSNCPTTSSSPISGAIESGATCNLVLAIDRQLLTDSATGGSTVLNFTTPTASWTTPLGFYSQSGNQVYANYLQPTITFALSNNNGNFESTVLTMTAVNGSAATSLSGKVWGLKNWLESVPLNLSSNCTVNSSDYSLSCDLKTASTGNVTYIMPNYLQAGESDTIPLQFSTNSGEYAYLNPGYTFINYSMLPAITRIYLPQTGQLLCVAGTTFSGTCALPIITSPAGSDGYGRTTADGSYIPFGVPWAYNGGGALNPTTRFTGGTQADGTTACPSGQEVRNDNLTGLMWVQSPTSNTYKWQDTSVTPNTYPAQAAIDSMNNSDGYCGYKDWRLPNVNELASLVNQGSVDSSEWLTNNTQGFSNVRAGDYWSSTTYANGTNYAWSVNMNAGLVNFGDKANDGFYVLPVRGGQ